LQAQSEIAMKYLPSLAPRSRPKYAAHFDD
jgi:hypothetical protein